MKARIILNNSNMRYYGQVYKTYTTIFGKKKSKWKTVTKGYVIKLGAKNELEQYKQTLENEVDEFEL